MGQKVNPHGIRVGIIKDWDSKWYANRKNFGDSLVEDYKIRKYLKKNVTVAVLCALALITTIVIRIPVAFLTLDLKDTIITLTALFFGPLAGVGSAIIVPTLELITISDTGIYGFIMNVFASVTFCLPVGLIYKYKRTLKGAVIGLVVSVFSMTACMMIANLFITPYYTGMNMSGVAALIPTMLLPFNLVKATLNAALVLLLYKPLSRTLKN